MSGASGEYLDLTRAGHQPVQWAGTIAIAALPRLSVALADDSGQVSVELRAMHDGGQVGVRGTAKAKLALTCQRCFGSLEFPVETDFNLAWVRSEDEASKLPEFYEPLLSASGHVKISEIIEDELLLALPMVALHAAPQACGSGVRGRAPHAATRADEPRTKPFAALKALKRH